MIENVFSTQLDVLSNRQNETVLQLYKRVRRSIHEYLVSIFQAKDADGKMFSDLVSENDFLKSDISCTFGLRPDLALCRIEETDFGESRAFLLLTAEPQYNKYYKWASDHTLCTEIILIPADVILEGRPVAALRVSVRSWVEYQPFAGFFKTSTLPRKTPEVCECICGQKDVSLYFEPRRVDESEMAKNPELHKYARLLYPVKRSYSLVSDEKSLDNFKKHLRDPFRPVPLVVFFGDTYTNRREARIAAVRCWSKCRVWILRRSVPGLADVLERSISGIDVVGNFRWGFCRIFFPRGRYRQDDAAQPCYWVPIFNRRHLRKRMAIGLLRFFQCDKQGWITSENDLRNCKREWWFQGRLADSERDKKATNAILSQMMAEQKWDQKQLNKVTESYARAQKNFEESQLNYHQVQNDLAVVKREADSYKQTIDELRVSSDEILSESAEAIGQRDVLLEENVRLKMQVSAFQGGRDAAMVVNEGQKLRRPGGNDGPDDFKTLQWAVAWAFPDMAVVPSAWEQMARKKNSPQRVKEAWRMFCAMQDVLVPLLFDKMPSDVPKCFQEKTGFGYSPKDSSDLPPSMDKKRNVYFEGKDWRIEHHIKSGNRDATLMRIYFDVDHARRRLIIGSIGDHLPNLGTLKNS